MPVKAVLSLALTSPVKRHPPQAESLLNGSSLSSSNGRKIPQFNGHITHNSPSDMKLKLYLNLFSTIVPRM